MRMRVPVFVCRLMVLSVPVLFALSAVASRASAQSTFVTGVIVLAPGLSPAAADAVDAQIAGMVRLGELVRLSVIEDPADPARFHEYFEQRHRGVPVAGGGIARQRRQEQTLSAFGRIFGGIDLSVSARLTPSAATRLSASVTTSAVTTDSEIALVILPGLEGTYRLTYRATWGDQRTRFVDANSGEVVRTVENFSSQSSSVGTGIGTYGDERKFSASRLGPSFEARDQLRPGSIETRSAQGTSVPFDQLFVTAGNSAVDADNRWTDPAVVDAHVNAGWMYDYLFKQQGWQSVNGQQGFVRQVVADRATILNNAYFAYPAAGSSGPGLAAYGVSSSNLTMATLDIVGHELMHGVTFFSLRRRTGGGLGDALIADGVGPSSLSFGADTFPCSATFIVNSTTGQRMPFLCVNGQYALVSNPSGALNEGFSDIFGAAAEFFYQSPGEGPLRADYRNGEDAGLQSRRMDTPALVAAEPTGLIPYPDHFDRRVRYLIVNNAGEAEVVPYAPAQGRMVVVSPDGGGVHFNATIIGQAFYLAIEGGRNATSGLTVEGVGRANRAQVERAFFRAMTMLMPPTPTFPVAAGAVRQAAVDLYGASSSTFRAVDQALRAVGL